MSLVLEDHLAYGDFLELCVQVSTEVDELSNRLSSENAAAELVADRIKATCWDAMEVRRGNDFEKEHSL